LIILSTQQQKENTCQEEISAAQLFSEDSMELQQVLPLSILNVLPHGMQIAPGLK